MLKPWCFQIVVLEKNFESPLDSKEIKSVNSKEINSEAQMYRTVSWTLWEREAGMIWENDTETCIISYKK